ncbi:CBS domain-containing protein [Saccharopolyspora spinosa]|nr:CBS domain-containing protein [Saccharopolyspora spinosa]
MSYTPARLAAKSRDLNALVVTDPTGRPIGVVTEVDILTKLEFHGGADYPPLLAGAHSRSRWHESSAQITADLMITPANTVTADICLGIATHILASQRLRRLCVVDDTSRLIGMLARQDVLRLFLRCDSKIAADIGREVNAAARGPHDVTDGVVTLARRLTSAAPSNASATSPITSRVSSPSTTTSPTTPTPSMITGL